MATARGDERLAHRGPIQQLLTRPEIGALLGLAGVWLLFWLVSVPFGTAGGTANFLDVAAILGVMSVPVALLMIGGEFDLSSGSMTGATAIFVILLSKEVGDLGGAGLTLHVAVPLSLAFALAIGWANGTLVEKTSLPSFIVTLGTFFMLIGAKLAFAKLFTNKVIVEGLDEADGYSFWDGIFGAEWIRNAHIWDGRDWAWTALLAVAGVALLAGMFELSYSRRNDTHPFAIGTAAVGAGAGVLGFAMLLTTDGTASNWGWGAVIGAGTLVGVWGWCTARYEPAEHPRGRGIDSNVVPLLVTGVIAIAAAVVFALVLDETNADRLNFIGGGFGRFVLAVGIAATGVLAVLASMGRVRTGYPVFGALVVLIPTVSYMVTVQGARAILFSGLAVAGLVALSAAGTRMQPSVWIPMLVAVLVAALAFFVQFQSDSRKLRVELFTALLLLALFLAAAAIANNFAKRRTVAPSSPALLQWSQVGAGLGAIAAVVFAVIELVDSEGVLFSLVSGMFKGALVMFGVYAIGTAWRLFSRQHCPGKALVYVGMGAAGLGLMTKLLFITTLEEEATQAVTRFRVSILFYLLFAAAGAWLLARTRFGSWTFAVGGNKEAARSIGVPAARTKTTLFMMVSGSAWVAGMLIAFRLNSVQADVGDGNEFRYIIIAVVGGNLLTGGYGSAIGAAIGALIWGMISQGIGFATWNTDWRFLVLGGLLVVAVIGNNFVRTRAERSLPSARDPEPPPASSSTGDTPSGDPPTGEPPSGDSPSESQPDMSATATSQGGS